MAGTSGNEQSKQGAGRAPASTGEWIDAWDRAARADRGEDAWDRAARADRGEHVARLAARLARLAQGIARRRRIEPNDLCSDCLCGLLESDFAYLRAATPQSPLDRTLWRLLAQRTSTRARSRARYERRLRRLNLQGPRHGTPVAPGDAVEQAELSQRLLLHMRALPEPWRSVMEGHYCLGLTRARLAETQTQAGRRLGAEGIKRRLREGREMLRRRLHHVAPSTFGEAFEQAGARARAREREREREREKARTREHRKQEKLQTPPHHLRLLVGRDLKRWVVPVRGTRTRASA